MDDEVILPRFLQNMMVGQITSNVWCILWDKKRNVKYSLEQSSDVKE